MIAKLQISFLNLKLFILSIAMSFQSKINGINVINSHSNIIKNTLQNLKLLKNRKNRNEPKHTGTHIIRINIRIK